MLETVHKNLYWNETSLENNFSLNLFPESKNEMKITENAAYEYCIYIFAKGCVCYIFTSLFCKFKGEHL